MIHTGRTRFVVLSIVAVMVAGNTTYAQVQDSSRSTTKTDSLEFSAMDVIILDRVMVIGDPEKAREIPGSAQYIDNKRLDKQAYNDITRILREIPGVNLHEEDGYGLRPNIGMRGSGSERSAKITVMEDGVLMAPAPYAAPAAYYFPTAGRMHGIEVRKGSSQIKHGPYTTGGALNLISTPIPKVFSGRTNLSIGQNNARNLQVYLGDAYPHVAWLVETYQANVDGYKKLDGGGDTGFDKKDYLAKFRLNTDREGDLYQEIFVKVGQTDETSHETYLGLTDQDFSTAPYRRYAGSQVDRMETDQEQYQVRYFIQPGESFDLTSIAYRSNFKRNWYKLDRVRATAGGSRASIGDILESPGAHNAEYVIIKGGTSHNDDALEVKANNRSYFSQGVQTVLGLSKTSGTQEHKIELGIRVHRDQIDRFQWVDKYKMNNGRMELTNSGIHGTESNRVETATAFASFFQYTLSRGRITLTPGIRYENITIRREDYGKADTERVGTALSQRENKIDVWIPGGGLDFEISPTTSAFLGIHKGFAPPGSKEGTLPENSINYEAGIRYRGSRVIAQGVVYHNDYSNLLGSDLAAAGGTGSGDQFNGGEAISRGLEFSLQSNLAAAFSDKFSLPLRIAYTYTHAEFGNSFASEFNPWGAVSSGDELPYIPKHQIYFGLGLEYGKFQIDLSGKHNGAMRTEAGSGDLQKFSSTDAHLVLDGSAEFRLARKVRIFAGIRNLSNKNYIAARRPAGVRPGLPRTFLCGIKTDF
jgi:Fe(3+) dicitrate transport protein